MDFLIALVSILLVDYCFYVSFFIFFLNMFLQFFSKSVWF